MLIYRAETVRYSKIFSDKHAAYKWTEENASYDPVGYGWTCRGSVDLLKSSSGFQVGSVTHCELDLGNETDAFRLLAFAILNGDPVALDAARDILRV